VAHLVSSDSAAELSFSAARRVPRVHLIVNARVATDPALLETHVNRALGELCQAKNLAVDDRQIQSFCPGQPRLPMATFTANLQ
jgi:hypothetical protein